MTVPSKVKVFEWILCRKIIPTRLDLRDKGIECPVICLVWDAGLENEYHQFFCCRKSQECYKKVTM